MTDDVDDNVAIKNDRNVTMEATVKRLMMNAKAEKGVGKHAKTLMVTGKATLTAEDATVYDI